MLSGEDFGYLKDTEQNRTAIIAKKALLLGSVLFSISCFVYITVNAYYFAYQDKDSNIKVIKSPSEPIKVISEDDGVSVKDIDKTIYDNIVGNRNAYRENFNNVKVIEQVAAPLVKKRTSNLNQEDTETKNIDDKNKIVVSSKINNSPIVADNQPKQPKDEMVFYNNSNGLDKKDSSKSSVNDASLKSTTHNEQKVFKGMSRVQVAALSSKNSAVEYWSRLKKSYPSLLSNLNYFTSEVNLGKKGTFYRLQIGNFKNQVDAEEFCRKFISQSGKSKADCIIVE
jgi:cell division septation protein DedD